MSSVREYAVLYVGRGGLVRVSGGSAMGGNVMLTAGPHALDGPEHTGSLPADRVSVEDLAERFASDDVEAALAELAASIDAANARGSIPGRDGEDGGADPWWIPPPPLSGGSALLTTFSPHGSIAATDVQHAIQEVRDEALPLASLAAAGDMPYLGSVTNYATPGMGASATASSTLAGSPSNVLDQNPATYWHPNSGGSGSWVRVDLGSSRTITGWRIWISTSPNEIPALWILQYAVDGVSWTTVDQVSGGAGGDKGARAFGAIDSRYWRAINSGSVAWDPPIYDLYLYGDPVVLATPSTAFSRSLLDDPDAATARQTLGIAGSGVGPPGRDGDDSGEMIWWGPGGGADSAGAAAIHAPTHYAAGSDPLERVWMPLTTVVAGVPELVWDSDDGLIPTEVPI